MLLLVSYFCTNCAAVSCHGVQLDFLTSPPFNRGLAQYTGYFLSCATTGVPFYYTSTTTTLVTSSSGGSKTTTKLAPHTRASSEHLPFFPHQASIIALRIKNSFRTSTHTGLDDNFLSSVSPTHHVFKRAHKVSHIPIPQIFLTARRSSHGTPGIHSDLAKPRAE